MKGRAQKWMPDFLKQNQRKRLRLSSIAFLKLQM